MKSVLLIGQSNMAGRGYLHEVTPIYNENLHRHGVTQIKMNKLGLSLVRKEEVLLMNGVRKALYFAMPSVKQNSLWKTVN